MAHHKTSKTHVHEISAKSDPVYDYCECGAVRRKRSADMIRQDEWHVCDSCRCPEGDLTEPIRRKLTAELNAKAAQRETLELEYPKVWDTDQLQAEFEVKGFLAPFVEVTRKSDGQRGQIGRAHV